MMKVKINFIPYYEWYAKWIDWKKYLLMIL